MIKNYFYFLICFLFFQSSSAQKEKDSLVLRLIPTFGANPLNLNQNYLSEKKDSLQITQFKFYISDLQITFSDNSVFTKNERYNLIDIENPKSLRLPLCKKNGKVVTRIVFNIGIDSTTSVSGALTGDLDPSNGMYWAWQSGYINMKMEGKSASCKTRKNEFQFHIGGYMQPFYAIRKVDLYPISQNLEVTVDVAEIFSKLYLSDMSSIMIPSKKAMQLADYSVNMFKTE